LQRVQIILIKRLQELSERSIEGINARILVKELKMLESNKIINRKAFATVSPTVEYSLTEKGKELEPVLNQIKIWFWSWPIIWII
jgi:DNA-binding HxlR family transcriptional regulator